MNMSENASKAACFPIPGYPYPPESEGFIMPRRAGGSKMLNECNMLEILSVDTVRYHWLYTGDLQN